MSLLKDVTVLDIGFMIAGPGAAHILSDFGADVIKLEPPTGDVGRRLLMLTDEVSVLFENYNRGKKSIAVDLATKEGREVGADLVREVDIIVTNLRPAFLKRSGLDWATVHALNPRAVYAAATTFGLDSELSDIAGGDVIAQAESGIPYYSGEPGGAPLLAQNAPADVAAAMFMATSTLAAYIDAQRTGEGRLIDISITDVYSTMDVGLLPFVIATEGEFKPERVGQYHPNFTPHGVFKAKDGYIVISAYGGGANSHWPRLAKVIGRQDIAEAEGYLTDAQRALHRDEIVKSIEDWFQAQPSDDESVRQLREAHVISARVLTPAEAMLGKRARDRKLVETIDHPVLGRPLKVVGMPARISGYEPPIEAARALGADTRSVLSERLGYSEDRIEALRASCAISLFE